MEEVDRLTGTAIGRPKSATFRTADLVGLDTLCHVSNGIYENCLDDESREVFKLPDFLKRMLKDNMLGSKTKQGFYKKIVDKNGKSQILSLDLKTFEYKEQKKLNFETLNRAKKTKNRADKFKILINGNYRA